MKSSIKRKKGNKFLRLLKFVYLKLFRINDSPQKIAAGLGLGVFLGIIPGTGLIAAFVLAWILHINKAAALLGSIITNTWLSIVTVPLSIRIGAAVIRLDWHKVYNDWVFFLKNFRWVDLFKLSALKVVFPVFLGNFIVALCLGLVVYSVVLVLLRRKRKKRDTKSRGHISG